MSAPDEPHAAHRERLTPSPAVWLICLAVASTLGLVALALFGTVAAVAVALVAAAGTAVALVATSARVEVSAGHLRAGRAQIPVHLLGRVGVVDAERMARLRGPDADARAYLCQRGWIREGVLVEVVDPQDRTPYWLVSSRAPRRLAAAISAAGAGTARDDPSGGSGQAHSRQTG